MFNNAQATGRIHVKRLMLAETGRYDPQFSRPYQTQLQGSTLNMLSERLAGATRFTGPQLAGVASQMIAPTANPEAQVQIAGVPWNERRLRFMMEVECRMLSGGVVNVMVLGYTNHPGVIANTGAIDQRMEFYVNSVISVRNQVENTPTGPRNHVNIIDNSHVLVNPAYAGAYGNVQSYKMRPEDVYAAMKVNHITPVADVLDIRTVLDGKPIASRRSNAIATDYAANLLDGYSRASFDQNFGVHREEDILEGARGYVQENMVQNNPFFKAISNYRDGFMTNFFTWADLLKLDGTAEERTIITMLGVTTQTSSPQTAYDVASGIAQGWGGSDRETQVATILSQSIPALMTDFGLTKVAFISTNRRVFADAAQGLAPYAMQSRISTKILDVLSFTDFDMSVYMDHFVGRIEQMVMLDVSFNNEMDFYVEMQVDLLGETWIKISLNGGPLIPYVTPSFADALTVPVVTQNSHLASQLSQDFGVIFHEIADHSGAGYHTGGAPVAQQEAVPANLFGNI
jgi:hypothetical protein